MRPPVPALHPGLALTAALALFTFGVSAFPEQAPKPDAAPTPEQIAFFETKIRPILATNCFRCHGKDAQTSGLRADSIDALRKGGDSGPALVPGDPDKSLLIHAVRQTGPIKMPPSKKLTAAEIADLEAWVRMGAPWPSTAAPAQQEKAPLWSLQPVRKPSIPKVRNAAWVANPIDAFVLAKLEAKNLKPAPTADRRTLIRRLSYDLTGLPPSAAEVDAFLADRSTNAYEKVVDRLLRSPRYGERWARLWLDVARYADTKGYVFEEDRNYYNAYTYRDWVIQAFNQDLPYDRFIVEQLAADRLPEVREGDDRRSLAALGFLTVGRRFLNQAPDIIDDRIDVTMRGFQAFTVECARCHDHKFDPIPTQDYYSLYAVFASSEDATVPISERAIREPWEKFNRRVSESESAIRNLALAQIRRLRRLAKDPAESTSLSGEVKQVLQNLREEQLPDAGNLVKLSAAFEPDERQRLSAMQKELADLRQNAPVTPTFAMAMADRAHPSDGVVFKRGNPGSPGDPAPRRFLLALSKANVEREHWTKGSGRLELAQAIASRENPLTARVFVNRIWQGHFGVGIVRTPSDFGHQGEKPTDPDLLDYLASTFMANGWSIKKLHKAIVMSATYRQSADASPATFAADPENRLWGRMNRRRLDLEQMRDSLMAASGHLDLSTVGGKSADLWSPPFSPRRAVYGFIERQNLPGIFKTFDFASPDSTSGRRFMTTVPQQALFFMNAPLAVEQAEAVAKRPEIEGAKDEAQRVRRLYRLLFERLPNADETAMGVAYLKQKAPLPPAPDWAYGYGAFDPAKGRVSSFVPFRQFSEAGYHVSKAFPDASLGYLLLNRDGGHPGRDSAHAAIRRWTAPATMTVNVSGVLGHGQGQGDGVRARIVSSRLGLLGEWQAHHAQAKTEVTSVVVQKGDTLDFVVDPVGSDAFDGFAWSPSVRAVDGSKSWDASAGFGPPPPTALSRVALYAQALMMTNEFLFVD